MIIKPRSRAQPAETENVVFDDSQHELVQTVTVKEFLHGDYDLRYLLSFLRPRSNFLHHLDAVLDHPRHFAREEASNYCAELAFFRSQQRGDDFLDTGVPSRTRV